MLPGRGVEVVALTLLVGCRFGFDTATLEIAPADLDLTVVNGVLVTQPFAAILVSSDGERRSPDSDDTA